MGNEQSQESSAQPKQEDPEQTDLSDIPDDRDLDPAPNDEDTIMTVGSPDTKPPRRKTQKQKRKKKKKKKGRRSSGDGEERRLSQHVPNEEEIQLLREREPEAFDVYDSSQVGDDDDDSRALDGDSDSRDVTSADVEAEDDTDSNDREVAGEPPTDVKFSPVVDAFHSPSVASTKFSPAQDDIDLVPATQPAPEPLKMYGRWRCPYAETHNCEITFSQKKGAKRHGALHEAAFTCTICGKNLARKDTLQRHMATHEGSENISADARQRVQEDPAAQTAADLKASFFEDQIEEPQDEKSPEYRTPRESSQDLLESDDGKDVDEDNAQVSDEHEEESDHNMIRVVEELFQAQLDAQSTASQGDEEVEAGKGEGAAVPEADSKSQSPVTTTSVSDGAEKVSSNETPVPKPGSKRKRDAGPALDSSAQSREKKLKRRKHVGDSPPTSAQRAQEGMPRSWAAVNSASESAQQVTERIVPSLRTRQSTIDSWAQRSNPGSGSRPSISASWSPPPSTAIRVEVAVASDSSKSRSKSKTGKTKLPNGSFQTNGLEAFGLQRVRDAAYTTPKGKNRAEPGLNYVSPNKVSSQQADSDESDSGPANFATSVARRTLSGNRPRKRASSRNEDSSSEMEEPQVGGSGTNRSKKTGSREPKPQANNVVECRKCHKGFRSEESLRLHLKDPKIHAHLYSCGECMEQFWSMNLLSKHEKETGHDRGNGVQGLTGHFSEAEVQKLQDWRDTFCADHKITVEQFNDMMTDTLKRRKGESWDWHFISKRAFLNEYYEVLPHRNRRSMTRYRERNFQNLEGSKNWTADDDKDLIRLYKELGPKWSEIAQRLTRTTDAVAQRWRHKLQHKHNELGKWTAKEEDKFTKALEEVRRTSGLASQAEDWHIPWNKVSEKVGTRSALQCSNHYRVLHSTKRQGRWIKVDGLEKTPGSSRILTPSKMERRLKGQTADSARRSQLSQEYVNEEDDEDDEHEPNDRTPSPPIDEDVDEDVSDGADDDVHSSEGSSSHRNRNPLQEQTPNETLRPTQLFGQTQANTSVVRPVFPDSRRHLLSQDAPSPKIPIQRQQLSVRSPLSEIVAKEDDDESDEEAEDEESEPDSDLLRNEDGEDDSEEQGDASLTNGRDDGEAEDREIETSDEDQDHRDEELDGNDFMNSIEQSAQRVRSNQKLKLQPATRDGGPNGVSLKRRNRWSMSSSESDG
ncbi:hypothetical protein PV08_10612 [Exophiala spinifera]|uniref:Uncharacterized protein n=1 Tax=Exophiala spinifera TaxID=91928 RepID=A0A0D1ZE76_9EURO|nr:uncharacterized protein PV08_10612 [Exophiala spinifera]KIW11312.1 hypothetical protein PV08_10612 [Exophiala spinifera]